METKKAKVKIFKSKKWLRRILMTLTVIILLPIGLFTIGWLNRDTIIDQLQDWYSENNTGTLTIEKVNANFLSGFPKVGFTLKEIRMVNTDTVSDQFSTLYIEEAKVSIAAGKLLRGDIKFEKIDIKNAIITSEVISKRSFKYHEQLKTDKQRQQKKEIQLPTWLNTSGASFSLKNVKYITTDSILNKYFNLDIHTIRGSFKGNDIQLIGTTFLDITVNNLGFNTKKGSFSNGARFKGKPKFKLNHRSETIEIPDFSLQIDSQIYKTSASFDLSDLDTYVFNFQNDNTDFNAVKGLLTESLASKVKNYEIKNSINSKVTIAGKFAYGNNPDIDATFSTTKNDVTISEKLHLENTSFSGYLTTNIYKNDSLLQLKKSPKDIKIHFDTIKADLEDIEVNVSDAYYQSTPETLNFVEGKLQLEGSNESLARSIETDNFDFKGGRFQLDAIISGDIPNPYQFLNKTTGHFKLNNTQVILKKNGLRLPIQVIDVSLKRESSILRQLIINLPNEDNLVLKGELKNISGLLSKNPKTPTTSQVYLDSRNLNINEIVSMAKSFIPKSEIDKNNRKTLHETLEAIYSQFHPEFGINVDVLQYNDVIINEIQSNIDLVNSETIRLQNFDFKYHDALTNLKGSVKVHGPESRLKDAIYMDAEATSSGSIMVFKELFNIKLFRIDSGTFKFNGKVKGNVKEFTELLNNAQGDLTLNNTILYYQPADVEVAIDSLSLFVDRSDILLKKFSLEIDDQYPINLTGSIKKYPNFLLDNQENSGSISLKISAPYIDGDDLLATIKSFKNEEKIENQKTKKPLQKIFKDVNKFNPQIELAIDSLKFNDLTTKNIRAAIYFENDSILQLNHLDLNYKETSVNIEGNINAHSSKEDLSSGNPFDLDFFVTVEGKSEDLNDYLKTSNFIFKSGDFEFVGNYNAQSEDLDIMNSKTFGDLKISNTRIDFKVANIEIPVDSLHLEINDNVATLKTLDIKLPGKSDIYFSGTIDNFSEFINGTSEKSSHSSNFTIKSPYLATTDIKKFIKNSTLRTPKTNNKEFNLETFKRALNDINTSFYPSVSIAIDTLNHNDIDLTTFGMDLFFDTKGDFSIEETQFDFYGGNMLISVDIGMKNEINTPMKVTMQGTDIDLQQLVTRFDYFNNDDLRNTDKIKGLINFDLKAFGTLDSNGKVNMSSLNGVLVLDITDLALYNYKPIMDNSVLMNDERFKNLEFRPIVQTFKIKDGVLIIPRTEIQSSALHLFVEGKVKFNDYINVWLSLPWSNLKSNDGLVLPEKTSYDEAGSKFYVQLLQDNDSDKERKQKLNVKLRLSNRKLKKQKERQEP